MKASIKIKFYKLFTSLLCICAMGSIFLPVGANASTKDSKISKYYYVFDDDSLLTRENIDEIGTYGQSLNAGGVKLIMNVKKQTPADVKKENQSIFYNYIKENNGDKKVIVCSYYTDSKEFIMYDDYGIFSDKEITKFGADLAKYQTLGRLQDGIMYTYKTVAKDINKHFELKLDSISSLQIEDISTNNAVMIRNILAVGIFICCAIGFRRNKNIALD